MRDRAVRMGRIVADYATPWRVLMLALVGAGLLLAVALEHPLARVAGIAVASLAIFVLLAQLDRQAGRSAIAGASRPPPATRIPARLSWPIVSVVVAGRNDAPFAADCIRSLQAQTLEEFEAIVIDDASTDSTLEVLLEAIGDDPRFRIVRTGRSVGVALARNHGAVVASARYVTFLDLHDLCAPDALASRVAVAEQHAGRPWVAGSYSLHGALDDDATSDGWRPGSVAGQGLTLSWLDEHDDGRLPASALLIRRDAFESIGGFDDAAMNPDAAFWLKLLRVGFTLVGTGIVSIGSRQTSGSVVSATADAAPGPTASPGVRRADPTAASERQAGPFFFAEEPARYGRAMELTRRTAAELGMAVAAGSSERTINDLVDELRTAPYPLVGWVVDVRSLAIEAARGATRAGGRRSAHGPMERELERLLEPLVEDAALRARAWLAAPRMGVPTGPVPARPVRRPRLIPVSPSSIRALRAGRPILLLPAAAYHTDELIELVDELRCRGFTPLAMLDRRHWRTTGTELARADVDAFEALEPGDWLHDFEAILTFNDWAHYYGAYVGHVRSAPTVSFAKVEGVQDWLDHDTRRVRNPYLASDVVLCQGRNDVRALEGRRDRLEVVGSSRLEAIWNEPLPPDAAPRVVGNVNFTYEVQTEHRDAWVKTLREACERAGVPLDLSLHPAERSAYRALASDQPLRHLVVTDSILVSRFSTVLFEGMARGCSVIYYNPHGEQVPTFKEPKGAFDVAEDVDTLTELIRARTAATRAEARDRACSFFLKQVSIVDGMSPALRTADAIERNLGVRQ